MSTEFYLLAVLVALLLGLVVGKAWERYKLRDGRWIDRRRLRETPHYMLGLHFLVENQVDQAIDELAQAASTDSDALEIQMILGNLYRQKGHVSRAINVHQALLQRPNLTKLEHAYVLLCLGLDFRHARFVDRAVEAFQEVLQLDPKNRHALVNLQKLYEEQHQWGDALRVRQGLATIDGGRCAGGRAAPHKGHSVNHARENPVNGSYRLLSVLTVTLRRGRGRLRSSALSNLRVAGRGHKTGKPGLGKKENRTRR